MMVFRFVITRVRERQYLQIWGHKVGEVDHLIAHVGSPEKILRLVGKNPIEVADNTKLTIKDVLDTNLGDGKVWDSTNLEVEGDE